MVSANQDVRFVLDISMPMFRFGCLVDTKFLAWISKCSLFVMHMLLNFLTNYLLFSLQVLMRLSSHFVLMVLFISRQSNRVTPDYLPGWTKTEHGWAGGGKW